MEKIQVIREKMKQAQDQQKSYTDQRRRPLEFEDGDHVYSKVTPRLELERFSKTKKLSPKYIAPYHIMRCVGEMVYQLAFPQSLSGFHKVIHVYQLWKFVPDPLQPILPDTIEIT